MYSYLSYAFLIALSRKPRRGSVQPHSVVRRRYHLRALLFSEEHPSLFVFIYHLSSLLFVWIGHDVRCAVYY
jgi:hypothetical protein